MSDLRTAAQQALEALETLVPTKGPSIYNSARDALRAVLAQQEEPRNQCGETCERAKLCATCAQALAQQDEPQGCATEEDCTKQPWCRIRGECQRKQAEPQPMPPEQRQRWEELAAMPQQAEPVNAAIEAVEETNAAAIRARSNT